MNDETIRGYTSIYAVMFDEAKAVTNKQDKTILAYNDVKFKRGLLSIRETRLYEDLFEVVKGEATSAMDNKDHKLARKLISILEEFNQIFKEKINE